ncbi:MAG TPA: ABC transporter permease, partial [Steroidobacteraceae bacterium]
SRERVLENISSLGTNTLEIRSGRGFGDLRASRVETLRASDADALAAQSYVDSATPNVSTTVTARYRNAAANAQVTGVGDQFFRVRGMKLLEGSFFDAEAVQRLVQSVVIDHNTRKQFFEETESPIGKVIMLGNVPCRVIGVARPASPAHAASDNLSLWIPYTTAMARMLGRSTVSSITVRVADDTPINAAERAITKLLIARHGREDFFIQNIAEIRQTIEATTRTLTLFIGSIAAIALVVGGIGVMNIMLVSVTERTREIGVRIAVGARQADILQQFLIEAVLVCLIGGVIGIALAFALGALFDFAFGEDFRMIYSTGSIIAAFLCSTGIGIAFGYLPARNAARLRPIEALARE